MKSIIIILIAIISVTGYSFITYNQYTKEVSAAMAVELPKIDTAENGGEVKMRVVENDASLTKLAMASILYGVMLKANVKHDDPKKVVDAYIKLCSPQVDYVYEKERKYLMYMAIALYAAQKSGDKALEERVAGIIAARSAYRKLYVEAALLGDNMPGEAAADIAAEEEVIYLSIPIIDRLIKEGV